MGYPTPFVRSVLIDFSLLAPMLWFESTCVIEQRVWVVDTATDPFAVAPYITTTLVSGGFDAGDVLFLILSTTVINQFCVMPM